jgi:c-di-GMP-binding flagellar brake protein YcgR
VRVSLEVLEFDATTPLLKLHGFARDLSIGGACLILERCAQSPQSSHLVGKAVNIIMSPPNDAMALNIKGSIVWSQLIATEAEDSQALGIEFNTMSPNLSGLLLVFADNLYHAH